MKRLAVLLVALLFLLFAVPATSSAATDGGDSATDRWYPTDEGESPGVAFYFIYSETCPHCTAAKPFVADLEDRYDWLEVRRISTQTATEAEVEDVLTLADELGREIQGVPTFMFCERMEVGYDAAATTGAAIEESLLACHLDLIALSPEPTDDTATQPDEEDPEEDLSLPVLGDIEASAVSLPLFTVAVAGLDAFNPCAFFVLLFLLSLLVHARSRWRMAFVGGVFVVISGVMYFAFMAAWLNVFMVTGQLRWVTALAGAVAVVLAVFNLKDYFLPDTAGSISIPEGAKPGLFARMRKLTTGDSMPAVLVGTVALAAAANSYELLCTAGFPVVFTRVLTLNDLSTSSYYGYLALYNIVYVIPLLIIVGVFVWTLGSRKLSENEGRFLKLMSGAMMLGLGGLLLLRPELLENMAAAVAILATAVVAAVVISMIGKRKGWGGRAGLRAR